MKNHNISTAPVFEASPSNSHNPKPKAFHQWAAACISLFPLLTSCVDFNDATTAVNVSVQLVQPSDFTKQGNLSNHDVTMLLNGQSVTTKTDANGIAAFCNIVPDVYDISTSWSISADEYAELTQSSEAVTGATVSGSVNSCLISSDADINLPTSLSVNRDIVIGKIYYAGSRDNNNKTYMAGKYIELYNQSDKPVDVSGLYLGTVEAESTPAYTLSRLEEKYDGRVILLKQIYRIPHDAGFIVQPGGTVLICNSAIDHSVNNASEHSLADADFEVKDVTGRYQNNPATPAMEMIYQMYSGTSVFNILQSAPAGVVIFRTPDDVTSWEKTYAYGKTSGSQWVLCPVSTIIDGVEPLKNGSSGIDVKTKRLPGTIDAGYTYINAVSGWNGEVVYRRTMKTTPEGHKVLMDTNNSSNDFKVSSTIKPRQYDE